MAKKTGLIVLLLIGLGVSCWAYYNYSTRPPAPVQASGTIEDTTVDI